MDRRAAFADWHISSEEELTSELPEGFQAHTYGAATIVARVALLPQALALIERYGSLYRAAQQQPRIAHLQGRGVAIVTRLGEEVCVIRHYQRGGAVMKLLGDRYLGGNRALRELRVSEQARARGVFTPAVQAAAWYERGVFRRFDLATSFISDARDLASALFEANAARAAHLAATLLRQMLAAGLVHRDLNLKNVLVAREHAYVLDLDRATMVERVSDAQRAAMRARFTRSLDKWEVRKGIAIAPEDRRTLQQAFYG